MDIAENAALLVLLAAFSGLVVAGILAGQWPSLPRLVHTAVGLAVFGGGAVLIWKFAGHMTSKLEAIIKFPPPPSREWSRLETSYARLRYVGAVLTAGTFTLAWLIVVLLLTYPIRSRQGGYIVGAALWALVTVPVIVAVIRLRRPILQLARSEWRASLHSVVSPAVAKIADLTALAQNFQRNVQSAEEIALEVDRLSQSLQEDIERRQAEHRALLEQSGKALVEADLTQQQIDSVLAVWETREKDQRRRASRRDRVFDVLMVLLGAILGYAAAVAYSPDDLRKLLSGPL